MPEKILPKEREIQQLFMRLEDMKFDRIGSTSYLKNKERLEWEAPRQQEGLEISFSYYNNGLETVVHTSILKEGGLPAENDAAWVLIRKGDEVIFFSPRLHRTKNFISTLLIWAEIAQTLINERPLCPECKAFMELRKSKEHRSYRFICTKTEHHEKSLVHTHDLMAPQILSKLSVRAQRYWGMYKAKYRYYQKELYKQSLVPGRASKKRKKWKIGKPENRE